MRRGLAVRARPFAVSNNGVLPRMDGPKTTRARATGFVPLTTSKGREVNGAKMHRYPGAVLLPINLGRAPSHPSKFVSDWSLRRS